MSAIPTPDTTLTVFLERAAGIAKSVNASQLIAQSKAIIVEDDDSFVGAGTMRSALKSAEKAAEAEFEKVKKPLREAKAAFDQMEHRIVDPIKGAITDLDKKTSDYRTEQLRLAEEKRRAEEAAARKLEEDRRLQEAAAAVANGVPEAEALAVMDEPLMPVLAPAAPVVPKVSGQAYVDVWSAEVTDLKALVRYVAAHPEQVNLLLPNMPALSQIAKGVKSGMTIPGVKAVCRQSVRGRAAQ